MAPIYEQEWQRLQMAVKKDPAFGVGNWYNSVNETWQREQQEFDDMDFSYVHLVQGFAGQCPNSPPGNGPLALARDSRTMRQRHQEGPAPHLHWLLHVPSTRRRGRQRS